MLMRYNDMELERLLGDIESDLVERKEAWGGDAPEKGREAVCAFTMATPRHFTCGARGGRSRLGGRCS